MANVLNFPEYVTIIEIGSRSIRILTARLSNEETYKIVKSNAKLIQKMNDDNDTPSNELLSNKIIATVDEFRCESSSIRNNKIIIFGTEGLRKLSIITQNILKNSIPELIILSQEQEAFFSFFAGIHGLLPRFQQGDKLLVIDQGKGSMECAVGHNTENGVLFYNSYSFKLGTDFLSHELINLTTDFSKFEKMLQNNLPQLEILLNTPIDKVILMGSAATKLAFLKVRQSVDEKYSPNKTQNIPLTLTEIDQFLLLAKNNPVNCRKILNSSSVQSDEFEIVSSGLLSLSVLLKQIKPSQIFVSSLGTRHGLLYLLSINDHNTFSILGL